MGHLVALENPVSPIRLPVIDKTFEFQTADGFKTGAGYSDSLVDALIKCGRLLLIRDRTKRCHKQSPATTQGLVPLIHLCQDSK